MADLAYRTALITGASSGIGRELARWFAGRGVRVFAAARRRQRLDELRASEGSGRIEPVELDVAEAAAAVEKIREIDRACGGLDLVVANAGVGGATDVRKLEWRFQERLIGVNVTGAAATLCAAIPGMAERRRGHLVGISSIASFRGLPRHAGYSASKAFLATFLEGLRVDLKRYDVHVTSIHPGFVKSELTEKNDFPMPFLLETAEAAHRIGRAIVRRKRRYVFPWPLALAIGAARAVPDAVYDAIAPRLR